MASTFKDLVDDVRSNLAGYTMRQDRMTYLANPTGITTTTLTIQTGSSSNLAKGIIEIDDELFWVDEFNKSSNTMNIAPGFGRGYLATNPAPHALNSAIIIAPSFPRVSIKKAINDTINSLFPKLWVPRSTTFTYNPSILTYALPDDAEDVLYVSYSTLGPSKVWNPVKRWSFDQMANFDAFNSTSTITVLDSIPAGRTVQVWYTTQPNTLETNYDDFETVTGLPESCRDVIVLGACYRLLTFIDAGRINLVSAEADAQDSKIPSSASVSSSKYILALYQQRLQEESDKLKGKYPIRIHYSR